MSWICWLLTGKLGGSNTSAKRTRSALTVMVFPSGTRRFSEHDVIIKSNVAQFLIDIPSKLLSAAAVRASLLSDVLHRIHCRITVSQTRMARCRAKLVDGTVCETQSPVSVTLSVVRPETYRTVWVVIEKLISSSSSVIHVPTDPLGNGRATWKLVGLMLCVAI